MHCRACETPLEPFMSFGKMPLANGFLTEAEFKTEAYYELAPAVCPQCSLFQIMEQPLPDRMFHSQYPYYTSNSQQMQKHFEAFAKTIGPGFVVEIGCNDGTLLQHFKDRPHLGIEPAANVAAVARKRGCTVIDGFFDSKFASSLDCKADYILAANVICHVADLPDLCRGVHIALKDDGLFIFEEPYLPAMISRCSFDQIYDEHVFLFSVTSVERAFRRHGLYLIECQEQWAHGGSMRYTLSKQPLRPSLDVIGRLKTEYMLTQPGTYRLLKQSIEAKRIALQRAIGDLHGRRIVGYGATSKSTTVTVYCQLGPSEIEYISDTTPIKQGKFSPGAHIPVRPYEEFEANPPDVALLFAWNHRAEIMAKETFAGQWLNYVPAVSLS